MNRDSRSKRFPSAARRTPAPRTSRAQPHHGDFGRASRRIRTDSASDGARTDRCSGGIWFDVQWVLDALQAVEKLLRHRGQRTARSLALPGRVRRARRVPRLQARQTCERAACAQPDSMFRASACDGGGQASVQIEVPRPSAHDAEGPQDALVPETTMPEQAIGAFVADEHGRPAPARSDTPRRITR